MQLTAPRECLSEVVAFSTVQVPPDGQPIVLMADRQTTGGYPCIAQVAQVDLARLAQCVPSDVLAFTFIELAEAQRLDLARECLLAALERDASVPDTTRIGATDADRSYLAPTLLSNVPITEGYVHVSHALFHPLHLLRIPGRYRTPRAPHRNGCGHQYRHRVL